MPKPYQRLWPYPNILRAGRHTQLFITVIALIAALVQWQSAGQSSRELLNSERIGTEFGSYGIEVLEQSSELRVSNLHSGLAGATTCRTFAIVRYPAQVDAAVRTEHAAIVAGGSIGATFAARGWQVRKTHLHYGERTASAKLAALMHIEAGTPLAEHVYVLDVVKDGRAIEYAALVEIHHPDYLRLDELAPIYGPSNDTQRPELVATLLATAASRTR